VHNVLELKAVRRAFGHHRVLRDQVAGVHRQLDSCHAHQQAGRGSVPIALLGGRSSDRVGVFFAQPVRQSVLPGGQENSPVRTG
jgi:hypothetical protein